MSSFASREQCDHVRHMVDRNNDKTDGFLDSLLPGVEIQTAEAHVGCVNNLSTSAVTTLAAALPNMVAAIGPVCSTDIIDISNSAFRASTPFDAVLLSSGS